MRSPSRPRQLGLRFRSKSSEHFVPRYLLNSNNEPSESMRAVILASIPILEERPARHRTRGEKGSAPSLRAHVQLCECKTALSPVRQLPYDVLAEIFAYFIDHEPVETSSVGDTLSWRLGRVCSKWRAVQSSFPRRWMKVFVDLDSLGDSESKQSHRVQFFLRRQLEMSGLHPLEVYITSTRTDASVLSSATAVTTLFDSSRRWRRLSVDVPVAFFQRIRTYRYPILTSLSVASQETQDWTDINWAEPVVHSRSSFHAPHLRSIRGNPMILSKFKWLTSTKIVEYHTSNFKRMDFYPYCLHWISSTLHAFPSLQHSILLCSSLSRTNPRTQIHHLHLQSLSLYGAPSAFLNSATLPALRRLAIIRSTPDPSLIPALILFLSRSSCKLDFLGIPFFTSESSDVQTLLHLFHVSPSLKSVFLVLTDAGIAKVILDKAVSYLPRLEHFGILVKVDSDSVAESNEILEAALLELCKAKPGLKVSHRMTVTPDCHQQEYTS